MIRPRPTQHIQSLGLDGGHVYKSTGIPDRAPATCAHCGARLSVYRPPGDISCWACQAKAAVDPELLHPPVLVAGERQKRVRGW